MENWTKTTATLLDSMVADKRMRIIKSIIPFIPAANQGMISVFVKFSELSNTMKLFQSNMVNELGICSIPESENKMEDMLEAIKYQLDDEERENLEMFSTLFSTFSMFNNMNQSAGGESGGGMDPMSMFKTMLSPEQQSMFDMYSTAFNSMGNTGDQTPSNENYE